MPQISELFVSLGIKGTEKTINALSNVRVGLGEVKNVSLEAKAAILAAIYALERLVTGSAKEGAHLQNLSAYLGISAEAMQKWTWAAQQGNIANAEFEQSVLSAYNRIKEIHTTGKYPIGTAIFAQETEFDFTKNFNVFDLLTQALKFSKTKRVPRETIEKILEDWGLTPEIIGAALDDRFKLSNVGIAPFLKTNEINKLGDVNVAWENLGTKVKMFFSHFTAEHGLEAVKTLDRLATSSLRIAESFERIAKQLGAFKLISESFKAWESSLGWVADKLEGKKSVSERRLDAQEELDYWQKKLEVYQKNRALGENINSLSNFLDISKGNLSGGYQAAIFDLSNLFGIQGKSLFNPNNLSRFDLFKNNPTPTLPSRFNLPGESNSNTNINQNLYFQHEGRDYGQVQATHGKAIVEAYRMYSANSRLT